MGPTTLLFAVQLPLCRKCSVKLKVAYMWKVSSPVLVRGGSVSTAVAVAAERSSSNIWYEQYTAVLVLVIRWQCIVTVCC